jgi:hypothetical protein
MPLLPLWAFVACSSVNFIPFSLVYLTHDCQDFALRDLTWQKAIITLLVRQLDHLRIACARNTDYRRCAAMFFLLFCFVFVCVCVISPDNVRDIILTDCVCIRFLWTRLSKE